MLDIKTVYSSKTIETVSRKINTDDNNLGLVVAGDLTGYMWNFGADAEYAGMVNSDNNIILAGYGNHDTVYSGNFITKWITNMNRSSMKNIVMQDARNALRKQKIDFMFSNTDNSF